MWQVFPVHEQGKWEATGRPRNFWDRHSLDETTFVLVPLFRGHNGHCVSTSYCTNSKVDDSVTGSLPISSSH
ncbi:hypothetical protein Sjap_000662 [Stephania japonica]|uniref:Uncharacterized protein n=1 Tax=Stephania japonica TaxID=461633 RepID=A0AAP0KKV2_9MAGN